MMTRQKAMAIAIGLSLFFFPVDVFAGDAANHGKKHTPAVNIISPDGGSAHAWDTLVRYQVVVSYDGKSTKYGEIPSDKVILKTSYVPDVSNIKPGDASDAPSAPAGVMDIAGSNCLGCHDFDSRAMGPSFQAINRRYAPTAENVKTLVQHVKYGSTGVWGGASMPPHPALSDSEITTIVRWILKHASDPGVDYYVGTEGAFRMSAPAQPSPDAGLIVTASYTAPAQNQRHQPVAHGEDTVVLHGTAPQ